MDEFKILKGDNLKKYECLTCKRTATVEDDVVPKCCGKKMKKMPREICLQPAHAEHARPMEREEPCDEFHDEFHNN